MYYCRIIIKINSHLSLREIKTDTASSMIYYLNDELYNIVLK